MLYYFNYCSKIRISVTLITIFQKDFLDKSYLDRLCQNSNKSPIWILNSLAYILMRPINAYNSLPIKEHDMYLLYVQKTFDILPFPYIGTYISFP